MRRAGALAWRVVSEALGAVGSGRTTGDIAAIVSARLRDAGAAPAAASPPGRPPFPGCCAVCVNEEVAFGIPGDRILRAGDLVTIDVALRLGGWCADVARCVVVGAGSAGRELVDAAGRCLEAGLRTMLPGHPWSRVAAGVAAAAREAGAGLVRGYAGHGIGRGLHEAPEAWLGTGPGGSGGQDFTLRPGMVLTLEPIVTEGGPRNGEPDLIVLDDGWTVLAGDRRRACCEERTVAITRAGPVVLTGPG